MPTRRITVDGRAWRVFPSGFVTQYNLDEFGLIFVAGEGDNTVEAGDGANYILAGAGADRIAAGDGNDTILGGEGSNTILAGGGNARAELL